MTKLSSLIYALKSLGFVKEASLIKLSWGSENEWKNAFKAILSGRQNATKATKEAIRQEDEAGNSKVYKDVLDTFSEGDKAKILSLIDKVIPEEVTPEEDTFSWGGNSEEFRQWVKDKYNDKSYTEKRKREFLEFKAWVERKYGDKLYDRRRIWEFEYLFGPKPEGGFKEWDEEPEGLYDYEPEEEIGLMSEQQILDEEVAQRKANKNYDEARRLDRLNDRRIYNEKALEKLIDRWVTLADHEKAGTKPKPRYGSEDTLKSIEEQISEHCNKYGFEMPELLSSYDEFRKYPLYHGYYFLQTLVNYIINYDREKNRTDQDFITKYNVARGDNISEWGSMPRNLKQFNVSLKNLDSPEQIKAAGQYLRSIPKDNGDLTPDGHYPLTDKTLCMECLKRYVECH